MAATDLARFHEQDVLLKLPQLLLLVLNVLNFFA